MNVWKRRITYTSDYFPQMVEIAKKMLRAGHMYADNTEVDKMREERLKSIESKHRGMPAAEAERVFNEMLKGSEVRGGRVFLPAFFWCTVERGSPCTVDLLRYPQHNPYVFCMFCGCCCWSYLCHFFTCLGPDR